MTVPRTFVPLTRHTRAVFLNKVKVKTVPLNAKQAQRRGTGIVLPLLDHGARREWVVNVTLRPLYSGE